jgi:hypothetical protein
MNTSIFLAKLIGPLMTVIGLAVIVNGKAFDKLAGEFLKSPALLFLSGFMLMPAGLAIVLTHNVWVWNWPVIITVLGWASIISGAIRLAMPVQTTKFSKKLHKVRDYAVIAGVGWAIIGLTLCYFGYR